MSNTELDEILSGLFDHRIVPYIGAGALYDSVDPITSKPIPADSDSLILAMNNGQPMAPKLMYEFPRAAMNLELKKGRSFITRFLNTTYAENEWTRASVHTWLAEWKPNYVVDINRDTQLQLTYSDEEHTLIVGVARITETHYRYKIFHYDKENYFEIDKSQVDPNIPVLFKPMGTPLPEPNYIASDADYVDYITELMGGFAIPDFLKAYRKGKQYLFLGVPFNRDSERMVLSDIIYSAKEPIKGWVLNKQPTAKEIRFCEKLGLKIIDMDVKEFLTEIGFKQNTKLTA